MLLVLVAVSIAMILSAVYHYYRPKSSVRLYQFWSKGNYYVQQGGNPSCKHENSDTLAPNLKKCLDCCAFVNISRHPYLR
jgi:hypothetical protein